MMERLLIKPAIKRGRSKVHGYFKGFYYFLAGFSSVLLPTASEASVVGRRIFSTSHTRLSRFIGKFSDVNGNFSGTMID